MPLSSEKHSVFVACPPVALQTLRRHSQRVLVFFRPISSVRLHVHNNYPKRGFCLRTYSALAFPVFASRGVCFPAQLGEIVRTMWSFQDQGHPGNAYFFAIELSGFPKSRRHDFFPCFISPPDKKISRFVFVPAYGNGYSTCYA